MKKFLAALLLVLAVAGAPVLAGCSGHEHSSDPTRESAGGMYSCPRHGGSYASDKDHCKSCGGHVQKK